MRIKPHLLETRETVNDALRGKEGFIEPKLDGWRGMAEVSEDGVKLFARSGAELNNMPEVNEVLSALPADTILDGELVARNGEWGVAQSVLSRNIAVEQDRKRMEYRVFDVIRFDGVDSGRLPYVQRREFLESVIHGLLGENEWVKLGASFPAEQAIYEAIIESGFEGAVVKTAASTYHPGRRGAGWYRLKPNLTLDVVAMGFDAGEGDRGIARGLGCIRFGQMKDGELVERGGCGTGFYDDQALEIWENQDKYIGQVFEVAYFGCVGDPAEASPRTPSFKRWRIGEKAAADCEWEVLHR